MRILTASLLLGAIVGIAGIASPAQARDYRYCIYTLYGEDCSFDTYAQCQASLSGRVGDCNINRRFAFAPQPAPRHRVKHKHH